LTSGAESGEDGVGSHVEELREAKVELREVERASVSGCWQPAMLRHQQ
jgi:hypothetical protein